MREILFRGKRTDVDEWIFGDLIGDVNENPFSKYIRHEGTATICRVFVETVGEFSGVFLHGKRIFEGDILKLDYIGEGRGVQGVAEVAFQNGKFGLLWGYRKELVPLDGFANVKMEIIGNIHDNPELLGGGE